MASAFLQSSLPITISESDSTSRGVINFGQKPFEGKYNYSSPLTLIANRFPI